MKLVIQRVSEASVKINQDVKGQINKGLLVLIGIGTTDTKEDIKWLAKKLIQMRIFSDSEDKMNLSLMDVDGDLLVISQFTLQANTKKGNRPSYIEAARPEQAIPLYEEFIKQCETLTSKKVERGVFGGDMKVALINDGPVTIVLDSKNKG